MSKTEEEKENEAQKWQKTSTPDIPLLYHVRLVVKRITHQRDVGKALEPIFVPRELDTMRKPMMTQMTKETPRSLTTLKLTPQANPLLKRILQRLQIHDYMSVRKYAMSDHPMTNFRQYIKDTNGTPSSVWQQQLEKAYIKTFRIVHNDRQDRYYEMDYTKDFETQFRPLQLIEDYNPQHIDPEYEEDPYWDDELYDKKRCKFVMTIISQRAMRRTLNFSIPNYPGPSMNSSSQTQKQYQKK